MFISMAWESRVVIIVWFKVLICLSYRNSLEGADFGKKYAIQNRLVCWKLRLSNPLFSLNKDRMGEKIPEHAKIFLDNS